MEACSQISLIYTTYHIFPVEPIKYLIKKDGETTMPFKLATGTKTSVSHLRVLFFPCLEHKATAHVGTKELNMRHQSQKGFHSIFVGITQHQKGYLVYVPQRKKIIFHSMLFFMIVSLVRWNLIHNHMQNIWLCVRLCHTWIMLHIQVIKLEI